MKSNYNKQPYIEVKGYENNHSWQGYGNIVGEVLRAAGGLKGERTIIAVDFYPGVRIEEIRENIVDKLQGDLVIFTDEDIFETNEYITDKIAEYMTDDRVFGIMCHLNFKDFINADKLNKVSRKISQAKGRIVIYGIAACLLVKPDIHIYADMARWEIQQRYRSGEISNWKHDNFKDDALVKYKRGFFFEWRIADRYKKERMDSFNYVLDTNLRNNPKMITGEAYIQGLRQAAGQPFRVVPFFDPGVWGGQWMKDTCDLERDTENYAWCFDCVPEENSLLLKVGEIIAEIPSIDLVFKYPRELLGDKVHARFGTEFPIRFDFLDTMGGQNLSLQVHPLTEYIQEKFGMNYTQDESYYLLDAKEDGCVYLGVRADTSKEEFFSDLEKAQQGIMDFPAEKHVNKFKAKKHDHFLIPAGTAHCSGDNTMVLEISSTPFIFTFKLWDWGRLGLDGKPRPIHLEHGKAVLQFDRNTEWVEKNLINKIETLAEGDGWKEERTGLHEREFIETRRHWFSSAVNHDTNGGVNVINLVEGGEAVVESADGRFEPFKVHYAETFIIPASVGKYTIRPCGESEGKTIGTIKAYVRT
ncbi:class I mannose-6-phosphate isomerase [Ruminiclostridium cellobioparum]|uniref:Phosphomannose isomerase n=1 Tax=Ruminiclostridium cellobioparum subsp. termitidis CT1112 TaxID=1195236 RepID=S0FRW5_RUMCE|nr:class I mannose-6-phosphate isomerase [Ruminiclostridium cellobioparum]EMS73091.1 Phosphomannose isomerase [Ruminiclostridium cellobioparum subsp. termitidis CT1112]